MAKLGMILVITNFAEACKCIEKMIDRSGPGEFALDDALRLETSAARIREQLKAANGQG
jgi:hypothetical protein